MSDEQTRLLNEILAAVREQTAVLKQYREELLPARHIGPASQPAAEATRQQSQPAKRWIPLVLAAGFLILIFISLTAVRMVSSPSNYSRPLLDPEGHLRQW
jgi:hypothetical protein